MIPPRFRSQSTALAHDLLIVPVAWFLAAWFRFNLDSIPAVYLNSLFVALGVLIPVQVAAFAYFGLYKGIWRFASLPDIVRIIKAVVAATVISMVILFVLTRGDGIPRSVPVLYALLAILLLGGNRLIYRWSKDRHVYLDAGSRVLIAGAGHAGEALVRDLKRGTLANYSPVLFVDDNRRLVGREIRGVPVVGATADIPALVTQHAIDLVVLAMPSATSKQLRRVVEFCEMADVPFRSVPELQDLLSGRVEINDLREVSIEDLLGRDPVSLDWPAIQQHLADKCILVSGGGGSIGAELCRQMARLGPSRLIILDNSEFNLYAVEMDLQARYPKLDLQCMLGDVTDARYVEYLFETYRPQVIFHAAAYKHVPMLEGQIRQAMHNNVLGTRTVAEAADRFGAEQFVFVSTDKAVNPTNVMGASKRAAEILCEDLNTHSKTRYITVRFGNVLGSAGSVIPLFRAQIANGGPVTVTDPRMRRYFMTIPEACQLIMQTSVLGRGGEIFVLDMGEPVKISYLAEQMIRLSGKEPGEDIEIVYTGMRPGEKLFEELFHEKEALEGTNHSKVFLARHREMEPPQLARTLDQIAQACGQMDVGQLETCLNRLVPEYTPASGTGQRESASNVVYLEV